MFSYTVIWGYRATKPYHGDIPVLGGHIIDQPPVDHNSPPRNLLQTSDQSAGVIIPQPEGPSHMSRSWMSRLKSWLCQDALFP